MAYRDYRMPTRREREQQQEITELGRRLASLERDPSAAGEIALLEAKVADRDAAIERLERKLADEAGRSKKKQDAIDKLRIEKMLLKEQLKQAERNARSERDSAESCRRRAEHTEGLRRDIAARLHECEARADRPEKEISRLIDVIAHLQAQIDRGPENSSVPPSSDPNRKRIPNSRTKSSRKPGAQPGHRGAQRRLLAADETVDVEARGCCPVCSGELADTGNRRSHQVTDICVATRTVEYVSHERVCSCCGKTSWDPFPAAAANEANYGPGVKSAISYLVGACNVSGANARGLIRELSGGAVDVSSGSVCNFISQFSKRAAGDIADIEGDIAASPVIGSDATFTRSAGRQSYIYVFHNDRDCAMYAAHDKKGHAALAGSPVEAAASSTIVHDHDSAYYSYGARHAECNAHIMRYLKGVTENEPEQAWAAKISRLLSDANATAKAARAAGADSVDADYAGKVEKSYRRILEGAIEAYKISGADKKGKYRPEGYPLARRMLEYADAHLLFMHDLSVPFENNRSERLLRQAKKKVKQSGGFRSTANGEQPYCDFLTIAETAKMRGQSPLAAVRNVFEDEGSRA